MIHQLRKIGSVLYLSCDPSAADKTASTYSHSVLGSTWYANSRTRFSAFSTHFLPALNRQLQMLVKHCAGLTCLRCACCTCRHALAPAPCLLQLQARSASNCGSARLHTAGLRGDSRTHGRMHACGATHAPCAREPRVARAYSIMYCCMCIMCMYPDMMQHASRCMPSY